VIMAAPSLLTKNFLCLTVDIPYPGYPAVISTMIQRFSSGQCYQAQEHFTLSACVLVVLKGFMGIWFQVLAANNAKRVNGIVKLIEGGFWLLRSSNAACFCGI